MNIDLKDIIDTLIQMHEDILDLYDCETIYSVSLNVAVRTLRGEAIKPTYWGDIL